MILELDKLEMLLMLEEENNGMEKDLFHTNTLQLLYPPPNPTIFPIKLFNSLHFSSNFPLSYSKSYC